MTQLHDVTTSFTACKPRQSTVQKQNHQPKANFVISMECTCVFLHARIDGEGEFTDVDGHVWMGNVSGKEALGLRLKLS